MARTMSANEIITAVSAKPERLPGGLGIESIKRPKEPPDEVYRTRVKDTLIWVLERMISPRTLALGIEEKVWFQETAIALAEDR